MRFLLVISLSLFVFGCVKVYRADQIKSNVIEYNKSIEKAEKQISEDFLEKTKIYQSFKKLNSEFKEGYKENIEQLYTAIRTSREQYSSSISKLKVINQKLVNLSSGKSEVITGKDPQYDQIQSSLKSRSETLKVLEDQINSYNSSSEKMKNFFNKESILVVESESFFKGSFSQVQALRLNYSSVRKQIDSVQKAISVSRSEANRKEAEKVDSLDRLLRTIPSRIQNLEVLLKNLKNSINGDELVVLVKEDPNSKILNDIKIITKEIQDRGAEFNRLVKEIENLSNTNQ